MMKFAKIHCGGCEKEICFIPTDNMPKEIEAYCEQCKNVLESQERIKEDAKNKS